MKAHKKIQINNIYINNLDKIIKHIFLNVTVRALCKIFVDNLNCININKMYLNKINLVKIVLDG